MVGLQLLSARKPVCGARSSFFFLCAFQQRGRLTSACTTVMSAKTGHKKTGKKSAPPAAAAAPPPANDGATNASSIPAMLSGHFSDSFASDLGNKAKLNEPINTIEVRPLLLSPTLRLISYSRRIRFQTHYIDI
jgi:hypothetical protein